MNFVHVHAPCLSKPGMVVVAVPAPAIPRLVSYGLVRWDGSRYESPAHVTAVLQTPGAFCPNTLNRW
jgi:hypothetical protein